MAQLNVRVPDELLERLKAESKRRGESVAAVVRDGIEAKLPIKRQPPLTGTVLANSIESTTPATVTVPAPPRMPNALQLSTRTGMPKAICQRMLDEGRVSVGADGRWLLDGNSV